MAETSPKTGELWLAATGWLTVVRDRFGPSWSRWTGPLLSSLILIVVLRLLGRRDLIELWNMMPSSWLFWIGVAVFVAIQPVADFLIFRKLWAVPASGLIALFRKSTTNELLLSYSGELQFFLWAERRAAIAGSAFNAVRDVAVLSALVGNMVTMAMLLLAIALVRVAAFPPVAALLWPAVLLVIGSMIVTLLQRRILAVTRQQFRFICAIHLIRSLATMVVIGLLWSAIVPSVTPIWWVLLAAARQIVTRLPLLPNREVTFGGIAAGLLHGVPHVATTLALVATAIFAARVFVAATLAAADLASEGATTNSRQWSASARAGVVRRKPSLPQFLPSDRPSRAGE